MTSLNRLIHGGMKQIGITEEDDKRAFCELVTGQPRLSLMSADQQQAVVDELRRRGYRSTAPASSGRAGKPVLDSKYLSKMRAMWIALYNLGEVTDRRDCAIEAFALGRQLPHLDGFRFIHTASDGKSVIEALKAWMVRAGVRAAPKGCPDYALSDGFSIALAQWRILNRDYRDDYYLWPIITGLLDLDDHCRYLSSGQWITVMNYLGKQVRAAKKVAKRKVANQ